MKNPRFLLPLFALLLSPALAQTPVAAPAPAAEPARASPRIVSPEVHADHRVTFRLNAPKASEVLLTGEFMKGSRPLQKDANGIWSITVGPLEPEIYHYNFTLDGLRIIDPANAELKTGSTASTLQSVVEVRPTKPAFYDGQPVPHGEVHEHWYESKALKALRHVKVYLPPGYDRDPTRRYPVLYLLHGANADENAWVRLGRANLIMDNLIAAGKAQPFIVVMPFAYGIHPGTPSGPGESMARFGDDLAGDLLPYIEARYRTLADRDHRAFVGLSMGGGIALNLGLNRFLDQFAYIGGFSSGLGRSSDFEKTYASVTAQPDAVNQKLRLLWVGCGTEDGAFAASQNFSAFLTTHKIKHTFRETPGAHTWIVWRQYLQEVAPLLFR